MIANHHTHHSSIGLVICWNNNLWINENKQSTYTKLIPVSCASKLCLIFIETTYVIFLIWTWGRVYDVRFLNSIHMYVTLIYLCLCPFVCWMQWNYPYYTYSYISHVGVIGKKSQELTKRRHFDASSDHQLWVKHKFENVGSQNILIISSSLEFHKKVAVVVVVFILKLLTAPL